RRRSRDKLSEGSREFPRPQNRQVRCRRSGSADAHSDWRGVAVCARVSGDPHSRQNLALAGFSALHLEQRIIPPTTVSSTHIVNAPDSTFKADWKRQQRAQPHTLGGLEQRVIKPWPRVVGHLQTNREVDASAGRDSYSGGQEPKAARMDAAIGFGDQIAPYKADLSGGRAVVPQTGMNFGSAAGWDGAPGAQNGHGLDRLPALICGIIGHGSRWWQRRDGR